MTDDNHTPYVVKVNASTHQIWKTNEPLLGRLDMELTERCNNDCIHCCINLPEDDAARMREISTEEVKRILTEAAGLGALSVRFTGGEPLLRKDFAELYLFARRLGMKVLLFTNARLITPAIADLFASIPPLEVVEVTVYGMTQESYEAVSRVKGSYEEFRKGIDRLIDRKIPFVVKSALLPHNKEEMVQFEEWAATLPAMKIPPTYSMFFDLRCRRDLPGKNRLIKDLRLSPEEGVSVISRNRDKYLKERREYCSKFMQLPGKNIFSCGAGNNTCCVDAYGVLQPCILLRHPETAYDLKTGSLKNAMTGFFPRLREMEAKNPDYLARCAHCFLKGLCEQCPAKSWMEHGTLDTPVDYFCLVAHAMAVDLGLLHVGENAWEIKDWSDRVLVFVKG